MGENGSKEVTDCNTATASGFYSLFGESLTNGPSFPLNYGTMLVINRYNTQINQIVTYNNLQCIRAYLGGSWTEWEWVNPPMELGVEYRTTKRYNGKVVFTISVNIGTLPNATRKTYNFLGEQIDDVVSKNWSIYSGVWRYNMPFLPQTSTIQATDCVYTASGVSTIVVDAYADCSVYSGIVTLEYTKP